MDNGEYMTAQRSDLLKYNDKTYSILKKSGGLIFNPRGHALVLKPLVTSNRRGWYATYSVRNDKLYLDALTVCGKIKTFQDINGTSPLVSEESNAELGLGSAEYMFADYEMKYSGDIYWYNEQWCSNNI
tara:strand:+ start:521 stop:907 length:387 start_codon:yes stop_codon:yes gene_type:complete